MKIKGFVRPSLLKMFLDKNASALFVSPDKCDFYCCEVEVDTEKYNIKTEDNLIIVCHFE